MLGNDLILGAVGILQFDVVAYRLKHEYNVDASFENIKVQTARWIQCANDKMLADFKRQLQMNLAQGWRRRVGLPGAVKGQPATDARALAGNQLRGNTGNRHIRPIGLIL